MTLTKEQIEAERVKFEKWCIKTPRYISLTRFEDGYDEFVTDDAWNGWLARSENTKAELPPIKLLSILEDTRGINRYKDDVIKSLESQGFKVVTK